MWNKYRFLFSSLFRRFQLLFGSLAVILLAVCLPLSASADMIHLNPIYGDNLKNSLVTAPASGSNPVNRLESQYTYGGMYNPLILADSQSIQWSLFKAGVYWSFGRLLPAGTVLSISCGGWFNRGYSISGNPSMHASVYNPWGESQDWNGSKQFLDPQFSSVDEYVQTSNGVYHGLLYQGTYTLPVQSEGIWLTFVGHVAQRTTGCYIGISCSDISYQGTPVSPAESDVYGTPESGAFDDTSTAIGDYESAESALMSGGESAISGAFDSLTSSVNSLSAFVSGFIFVQRLFASLVSSLPILEILLPISVGLGLFAMLIGIIVPSISHFKGGDNDDSSG